MLETSPAPSRTSILDCLVSGALHMFVARDWGERVDLERAATLAAGIKHDLPRRRRTPSSISYRPPPLRCALPPVTLTLPHLGAVEARAEATVFDFAAVSVELRIPFKLPAAALPEVAQRLSEPDEFVAAALNSLGPLYQQLLPAIQVPQMSDLTEEYFVFRVARDDCLPPPAELMRSHAGWLASLVRLERESLSADELAESLRWHLCYTPTDLFIPEWSAALLIDDDCEETLEVIEFANLQLLEFRYVDNRLDDRLADAYRLIHPLTRTWLPFWKSPARSLRMLGDLRMDAHDVYERTSNVLKLVGDQYLARLYRQLSQRFHLDDWAQSIHRSLDVVEGVYEVVSDQAAAYRTELMEVIVIVLITFEIIAAMMH